MIWTRCSILDTQKAGRVGARGGSHRARHHQERTIAKNGSPCQGIEMGKRRGGWEAIAVAGLGKPPWADEGNV